MKTNRINLMKTPKVNYPELVKLISKKKCISESSVRAALDGFKEILPFILADGKVVSIRDFGNFYPSIKQVTTRFLPEDHPDYNRHTINPRFRPASDFRNQLQKIAGYQISTFHQPKEEYTKKREERSAELNDKGISKE